MARTTRGSSIKDMMTAAEKGPAAALRSSHGSCGGYQPPQSPLVARLVGGRFAERLARYLEHNRPTTLFCSAKIEMEIAQLPPEEATAFLADLGIAESAVWR